jgi:hypothetical protein
VSSSLWMQRTARAHLLTLEVARCAGHNLQATATGYTKAPGGHFVEEGFSAGMEVTAAGFTTPGNNGVKYITGVTPHALAVQGGATPEGPSAGHTLTAGLPQRRAWEAVEFTPEQPFPFVSEQWLGGPSTLLTIPADGGWVETTPQYVVRFHVAQGLGMDALAAYADATLRHFRPGLALPDAVTGNVLRVRGDTGPFRGSVLFDPPGYAVVAVTIPLRVESRNI